MTRNVRSEDGWVVTTAVILMSIMLVMGLALMAGVDFNGKRAMEQRQRENSFTLSEGVLYGQSFILAQRWPAGVNPSYPENCRSGATYTGTAAEMCPSPATLAATGGNFTGVDFNSGTSWVTRVRDNYGPLAGAFDPAFADQPLTPAAGGPTCAYPCSRDFNGDRQIWVQARSVVRDKPRNVVALMKLEQLQENMPQVAVASGAMAVTNEGNHGQTFLMDGTGSEILVRCTPDSQKGKNATCTRYADGQVSPKPKSGAPSRLMTNDQIQRFAETAKVNGTYFTGCPPDALQGAVVFVEYCDPSTSAGTFQGKGPNTPCPANLPSGMQQPCINTITRPGLLIFRCGGMQASGNWTYAGIIYFANGIDGKCAPSVGDYTCQGKTFDKTRDVFQSNGGFGVWGVIAAEGGACLKFGSNNFQFKYDVAAFDSMVTYGTVGLVQNTWRELDPMAGAL